MSNRQLWYNGRMSLQPALCARFHRAVELVGRRWTGAVIRLLLNGRMRYAELRDAIPDISDRMLSERLRELETEGILVRSVVPETPIRVEYELTPKGHALQAAVVEIEKWASRWGTVEPGRSAGVSRAHESQVPRRHQAAGRHRARRSHPGSA
jgi:DNA-binding HxlR family transcriptional regulator